MFNPTKSKQVFAQLIENALAHPQVYPTALLQNAKCKTCGQEISSDSSVKEAEEIQDQKDMWDPEDRKEACQRANDLLKSFHEKIKAIMIPSNKEDV